MATESRQTPLGSPLPDVELIDADGVGHHTGDLTDDGPTVIAFLANHCPYVRHIETALGEFADEYVATDLRIVAVSSNDAESHPDDDVPGMLEQAQRAGWDFLYLRDPGQRLAHAAGAACTPDLFLYDDEGLLAYRGAFDGSTPANGVPVTGEDLRAAVDAVLSGSPAPADQRPSMGCGIKWTPGNEPT